MNAQFRHSSIRRLSYGLLLACLLACLLASSASAKSASSGPRMSSATASENSSEPLTSRDLAPSAVPKYRVDPPSSLPPSTYAYMQDSQDADLQHSAVPDRQTPTTYVYQERRSNTPTESPSSTALVSDGTTPNITPETVASTAKAEPAYSDYGLTTNIWFTRGDEMVSSLRTDTQYTLHIRIDTTEPISGARLALFDDLLGGLIITDRECDRSQQLICCLTATDQETMCSMSKFSAQDDEKLILLYTPGSAQLHTPGPDGGSSKIADQDLFNNQVGAYLAGTDNPDDQLPIGRNAAEITLSVNTIDYNGPLEDISDTRYDHQSDTVLIAQSALADNSEPSNIPAGIQNLWLIILSFTSLVMMCVGVFYLRKVYKLLNNKE